MAGVRKPRSAIMAVPALALALALTLAPAAAANDPCHEARHARAVRHGGDGRPPLVVGDSVLLGAVREIAAAGFEVDARGCRQVPAGLRLLAARRRAHTLPHLVVLALGSNGSIFPEDITDALKIVGPDRVLALVTPREPGRQSGARRVRDAGRRHRGQIVVLDWLRFSAGRHGWFAGDGIHLGPAGAAGLARLLRRALPFAVVPLCP
jgi:hypothetical protein